jgi:predicted lipid-binding transport protein (Tim44 family)
MSDEKPTQTESPAEQTQSRPPKRVSKARFAKWAGWIGGSLVCVLNMTTGLVPGGFLGFMGGAIVAGGLVWLILTVING